jgi:hypothetical protein
MFSDWTATTADLCSFSRIGNARNCIANVDADDHGTPSIGDVYAALRPTSYWIALCYVALPSRYGIGSFRRAEKGITQVWLALLLLGAGTDASGMWWRE